MKPLRTVDRDTRRARLLAARRRPIQGINRAGILSGAWDLGRVVAEYRNGAGSFTAPRLPTLAASR